MSVAFGIQGSGQQIDGAPDPGVFRELAQQAEALGYDSIWAGDHISYRNPILDVVVALSTFAAVTERITIGAGVVLLPLRHPSVVAKEFSSLDYVSGGRVILGVGVGGEGEKDFEAVGVPVRERGARTNEAMRALRALFSGSGTFSGRFFSFRTSRSSRGPRKREARRSGSAAGRRRPSGAPRRSATAGSRSGSRPSGLPQAMSSSPSTSSVRWRCPRTSARSAICYEHLRQRYSGDFSEHVVDRYCIAGSPEECAARLREYVDAGARHIVFNVCEPEDVERLREVARAAAG